MMDIEIGVAAGKIWHCLSQTDKASPTRIATNTGLSKNDVQRALGWLAREGKIGVSREGRSEFFYLIN